MLESPAIAIERSRMEVMRMADDCRRMMHGLRHVLTSDVLDEEAVKTILQFEDDEDTIQHEIVTFVSGLLAANVTHEIINEARTQLRIADEYESVSDCIATVLKSHRRLHKAGLQLPESEMVKTLELHDMVDTFLALVSINFVQRRQQTFRDAIARGASITKHAKALVKQLLAKMPDEKLAPDATAAFNRQIAAYRHVGDHLVNAAEALIGEK